MTRRLRLAAAWNHIQEPPVGSAWSSLAGTRIDSSETVASGTTSASDIRRRIRRPNSSWSPEICSVSRRCHSIRRPARGRRPSAIRDAWALDARHREAEVQSGYAPRDHIYWLLRSHPIPQLLPALTQPGRRISGCQVDNFLDFPVPPLTLERRHSSPCSTCLKGKRTWVESRIKRSKPWLRRCSSPGSWTSIPWRRSATA